MCFSYYALYLYLYKHIYIFYCTKLVLPTLAFTLSKFMWIEINLWCRKRIWKELYLWAFQNLSYSSSSLFHICMKCDCYPNINQSCAYPIAYTFFLWQNANPLILMTDQGRISICSISTISSRKVMRVKGCTKFSKLTS